MKKQLLRPVTKASRNQYPLDQSALYKIGSKNKLAERLQTPLERLIFLAGCADNYKVFCLPEEICPFTGKKKKERSVQEPKAELRRIHERIFKLLRSINPPKYVHGAVKGKSYRTNAVAHKSAPCVATFDIRKFYPSTSSSQVFNFWENNMKCAPDVAKLLMKLVCYNGAIPTGSPLSPILSVFANKSMFDKLNNLALAHGLIFTCYIDDLTFSGLAIPRGLNQLVDNLVGSYGHQLSSEKTKLFRHGQRKHVTGVVVFNNEVCVPHARFKKVRAIEKAIKLATKSETKLGLIRKISGLLGEAAFLDQRYKERARKSYATLRSATELVINRQK